MGSGLKAEVVHNQISCMCWTLGLQLKEPADVDEHVHGMLNQMVVRRVISLASFVCRVMFQEKITLPYVMTHIHLPKVVTKSVATTSLWSISLSTEGVPPVIHKWRQVVAKMAMLDQNLHTPPSDLRYSAEHQNINVLGFWARDLVHVVPPVCCHVSQQVHWCSWVYFCFLGLFLSHSSP